MPFDNRTVPRQGSDNTGTHKVQVGVYTGPTSYATGGESLTPASVGWNSFDFVSGAVISNGTDTRILWYNRTTQKLMAFVPSTNAEVANATNLSTYSGDLAVWGHG